MEEGRVEREDGRTLVEDVLLKRVALLEITETVIEKDLYRHPVL